MVGYWWALEDCTLSNGCLWAVPGSHRRVVKRRFKRSPTVSIPSTVTGCQNIHAGGSGKRVGRSPHVVCPPACRSIAIVFYT